MTLPPAAYERYECDLNGKLILPATIAEDYLAGTSARELAGQYGISIPTVLRFLDENDVPRQRPQRPRRRRSLPTERIVERYRRGATTTELSREFGANASTIERVLADAGVTRRNRGPRAHAEISLVEAIELLGRGWRLGAIAEHYGVDPDSLRDELEAHGVEFRGGAGRV